MQKQPAQQTTIPQHIVERMEDEWRQMRPVRDVPTAKPAPRQAAE